MRAWTLVASLLVNAYLLGVMVLFAAVSYPQLGAADRAAFPPVYASFTSHIGVPVVVWEFMALVTTLALYAWRPPLAPLWGVHVVVALGLAYFAITFGWHLPAHRALAAGDNSPSALAPLLASQWARTGVQLVRCLALSWLTATSLSA